MSEEEATKTDGSVTRELRKYIRSIPVGPAARAELGGIIDRIDAACAELACKAYDAGFASADDWYADKTDGDLAEHGLVRLPVDAAGRTWRVGDLYTLRNDKARNVERLGWMEWHGDCWKLDGEDAGDLVRYEPTPAERIREWVDVARDDRADLRDLLAIADELEAGHE